MCGAFVFSGQVGQQGVRLQALHACGQAGGKTRQQLVVPLRGQLVALLRKTDPLAKSKRLRLAQLASRDLLLVPDGTFLSDIIHAACERAGFSPRVRLTLASAEALRETVRAGLGITLLPRGYAAPSDRDLVAVPLSRPTPKREVLLVERGPGQLATPRSARAFVSILTENG